MSQNPFIDPAFGSDLLKKDGSQKQASQSTSIPVSSTANPFSNPDYGKEPERSDGVLDTLGQGFKSTGQAIGATIDTYTDDSQGVVDTAKSNQELQQRKDPRLQSFYDDYQSGIDKGLEGWDATWDATKALGSAVWDNPMGAGLAVAEQLPNSIPALAGGWAGAKVGATGGAALGSVVPGLGTTVGGVVGGVTGGLAGMFGGNALIETGHKAMEKAGDGEFTEAERQAAIDEGATKAGVITAVDMATLGTGRLLSRGMMRTTDAAMEAATRKALLDNGVDVANKAAVEAARQSPEILSAVQTAQRNAIKATDKLGKRAVEAGTLLSMETVGEGVGEYLGELAATGEADISDAVLEAALSLGQSSVEAGYNMVGSRSKRGIWGEEQQPGDIGYGLVQPTPTTENPDPAPVDRPDPNNGPISAAANKMQPVLTAEDLGIQFPDQQDWSTFDQPAAKRAVQAERGFEGLEGLIATAERMGFTDEVAQLVTARRLFSQAERARNSGNEKLAGQFAERGNRLYRSATEVNDQVREIADQFPAPYVATGEVTGGEVGPFRGPDRTGETYDQPHTVGGPASLEQQQTSRLADSGIIFGEEPEDARAARTQREANREQRQADDFSARYGQEGQTPYRGDVIEGELDRSNELPPAQRQAQLPHGTGQIDMGRDRPERTFTPTPTEYDGVGRNAVERQSAIDIPRLENRKTISQGEMIELTRQFREAVTTKPVNRTDEQKQIIKAVPKLKRQVTAGEVQVTENPTPELQQANVPVSTDGREASGDELLNMFLNPEPQQQAGNGGIEGSATQAPQAGQLTPEQQRDTDHLDGLINNYRAAIERAQNAEYQENNTRVQMGEPDAMAGDGPGARSMSIGEINERKRKNNIRAFNQQIESLEKMKQRVADGSTTLKAEAQRLREMGTPNMARDLDPDMADLQFRANGQPFASESAARRSMLYKQNSEFAEVVPVDGGFAVRVNTQAQNQAEQQAAASAQARSDQSKQRMYREPDPVNDDMLDAIALLGGIDRAEAEAQGIDPDVFGRQAAGIRYVFTRTGGDSFDGMAERISQYGYLDANANRLDDFSAKLDAAINGGRKIMTPEGYEALAEKQADAEAQLQQEHESLVGETTDEAWIAEAANMAEDAGVPEAVIQNILNQYRDDPIIALVEINDAVNQAGQATAAESGPSSRSTQSAEAEGIPTSEPLTEEAAADIWGSVNPDPEPLLTSYTEADLQAQADAQAAADQAEAQSQREAEQRVQADAERDDFVLSGSDRPADVAASRGQNDMFGAGSRAQTEQAKPSEQPSQSTEQEPVSSEQPAKKKLYIPTGIQSGIEATKQLNELINSGEPVSADEVRRVFDYVVGNEASIRAELNKLKKDQLKRLVNGHVWSDTKKAELVDRAYESMIGDFRFIGSDGVITSSGYGVESVRNQSREHVKALTDEQVAEYAKNRKAMIDERMAEHKARIERLTNPQTLEDYREAIRVRGIDKLTPEQRTTYDRLIAENTVNQQQPSAERTGLQNDERIELGEPEEATHGKTGETIFNVKVVTRLGKDKFKEAAAFARSMKGGYYRGNFYFKTREDAEMFSGWVNGDSVDLSERNQQRTEQKQAQASDRLKAMADRIEQQANEALNADRKENTAKRMREADYARANAEKDAAMAAIMRGVAESDSPLLKGMTQKVQVELMESMANSLKHNAPRDMVDTDREGSRQFKQGVTPEQQVQLARMPIQDIHVHVAKDLANDMIKTKGFKLFGQRLMKATRGAQDSSVITLDNAVTAKVVEFADKHALNTSYLKDLAANYKRLQRMGITNKPTLRTALLEYMQIRDGATNDQAAPNRLQTLERDLQRTMVGNRRAFNDFFPTPEAVAEEVIGQAEIEPGMRVLEPSAGNGMLADAAKAAGAEVDVVEMGGQLREILSEKGYNLVGDDFLEYQASEQYDRVVMNPPFSKDQDIEHVNHAYDQLKPGGKLVAIVSSMAGDRANTRNRQFREWLDSLDAVEQPLPEGAFLSSMNQTGANTKVLVIDKQEADTMEGAPRFSRTRETRYLAKSIQDQHPGVKIGLAESDTQIELARIELPTEQRAQGIGSEIMGRLIEHADKQGKILVLTPSADFGGNKARLTKWYKRFGFVENKGRNRDYEISETMYRPVGAVSFSRSDLVDSTATDPAIPLEDVERIAGRIVSGWKNAPEWSVVATDFDLPAELQGEIEEQNARGQIDGVFHEGRFYLVAEHIRSDSDVERIIFHEALGHYGLQQMYGPALKLHLDQLWNRIGGLDGINRLQKTYNFGMGSYWRNSEHLDPTERRVMMMDELVAHIAATGTYQPDIIQRIAHLVRQGLRKIMAGTRFAERLNRMTDVELLRIVAAARSAVVEGETRVTTLTHDPRFVRMFEEAMYGQARFSRTPDNALVGTEAKRLARTFSEAREAAKDFQGKELVNDDTKMTAVVSRNTLDKMLSRKAVTKSETPADHSLAVANADDLFKRAILGWSKQDRDGEPSIKAIHRYFAPIVNNGKASIVKLTVKETARTGQGNPLYSLESVELNERSPAAWWVETVASADGVDLDSIRSAGDIHSLANAVEDYNNGGDVRFSRTDGDTFSVPDETWTKVALRKMADKFQVLKDLQQNIKDAGGTVNEGNDAYLAEELFHGKTEEDLRKMRETFVKPLAEKMAKFGIEQKDLDQYLYAQHAPERNAHIADINPELQEAGSGMSDAKAAEIVRKVQESGKEAQYEQLAKLVYDMLATRRETMRGAGLEEDGMIDAWENSYEYYVPLKGWAADEEQDAMARSGKGFNIAGKESKRALGRSSEAASPSSFAIQDLTETLIRSRKNQVGNALLKLAEDNPNDSYWQVFTNDNPDIDRQVFRSETEESKKARADAKKAGQPQPDRQYQETVRETPIPMAMMPDKYFQTKRDGQTYFIKLKDERLMTAMKNIGPDTSNFLIQTLGSINRVLSSLNTSYNPEFVVGNFARDVQTAILNLSAEQSRDDGKAKGEKIAKQTVKDIPKAMRAVYRGLRNKDEAQGGEWQQWFTEFREAGAKTGWFDMKDLDGQAADLESLISMAKGGVKGKAMKWFKASTQMVEDLNGSVENAVRLSAYVNARKAGISKAKAASLAKNMTVNFNRRGEVGTTLNAFYMFANASIQGSMNFARTMIGLKGEKGDPVWQRLNTAQKIAAGLVMGSFAIAMMNRAAAGEDDDGENWYDKVPDYVKERNLVIMKSLLGGDADGSYWTIPLPYGYNIFHVFGNSAEAVTNGNTSAGKAATDLALAALGSFSPIGFQDSESLSGLVMRNITPTLGKPVADIIANENFMASSIYNENFPFGTPKPDSQLGRRSTPEGYKVIAEFLNDVSGGSDWRSGHIDINPDVIRYLANYFTGAAGKFVFDKAPNNVYHLATLTPIESREALFWSRVSGRVLPYADRDKFYDRRDEIGQMEAEWKGLAGRDKFDFYRENRGALALHPLIKRTEKQLKFLRTRRDRIYALDLPAREQDRRLEAVETDMKQVIDRFNREYTQATAD